MLMSHPGQGLDTWEDLKKAEQYILGDEGFQSYFQWMVTEFGFDAGKRIPYTFNPAPFIANKMSVQQGYITSEPYAVEKEGGFKPNLFLLADFGFDTYATTSRPCRTRSTGSRGREGASSMARPRAGTIISTVTTRPPTT